MNKLLVFTSTFPRFTKGDATPPFVYELSRRLVSENISITILTPRVPGAKIYEERDNMKIYRYPYFFTESLEKLNDGAIMPNLRANKWLYIQVPFLLAFGFIHLIRVIKKENIDTIHAHWVIPQGLLAVLYKKIFNKNIRIIGTSHGSDIFGLRGKIGTFLKRYTLKNINTLTVVSSSIKEKIYTLGSFPHLKVEIAPMGVDEGVFHPKQYDENIKKEYNIQGPFLLFVGRLAEVKGVKYLINAIPGILEIYPSTKLLIIGGGPLDKSLKILTQELNIEDNVIFIGPVSHSQLPKFYATADIFIGPSIRTDSGDEEGFGLVFAESIFSGCITIGSDLHGIRDIIEDKKTGFLIRQKDSKDIEKVILKALNNKEFDKELARKIIQDKFSWQVISKKYTHLLGSKYDTN